MDLKWAQRTFYSYSSIKDENVSNEKFVKFLIITELRKCFMTKLVIRCGKNLHLLKQQKLEENLTTESKNLKCQKG